LPTPSCAPSEHHRAPHSVPTRRSSDLLGTRSSSHDSGCTTVMQPVHTTTGKVQNSVSTSRPPRVSPRTLTCTTSSVAPPRASVRSEEHTSELQSRENLVCRLLLEKKKK